MRCVAAIYLTGVPAAKRRDWLINLAPVSPWPHGDLDEWVANSPVALVTFADA